MGFYAQQNYTQHLGTSNSVTISEAGCLLTSVSNGLLKMTGSGPDPATLNQFFIGHGAYVWDSGDQANDDLTWGSISVYDPTIRLVKVVPGSLPDSSNAIVKFHYNSVHTGQPIDHYCWVDHIEGRDVYIIDSWDGQVKGPSGYQGVYHLPIVWATFERVAVAATPQPPAPKYIITETYPQGRQIKLNKQPTNLYGMNYDFEFMAAHPVEVHDAGEVWTVTNKVHHNDGYDYYRRDGQVDGFNVADCDDYTPPPPPPYVPPAAPVPYPEAEKYSLPSDTVLFAKAVDAANDQKATGTLKAGSYYVYSSELGMKNLTSNASKDQKQWINPNQKLPETKPAPSPAPAIESPAPILTPVETTPPPAPVEQGTTQSTIKWWYLRADTQPVIYRYTGSTNVPVKDLQGVEPTLQLAPGTKGPVSRYTMINGNPYLLPDAYFKKGQYYAINETLMTPVQAPVETIIDEVEQEARTWNDFIETESKRAYATTKHIIADIGPNKLYSAAQKGKTFIDGFRAARSKK